MIKGIKGFKVLPRRWIVERTFGRLVDNRRLGKDYERMVQTGEALAVGMEVTIFDPELDADDTIAAAFVDDLVSALRAR